MKLNEKYFLNSLLSVAPRCALLPSVVGAYNTAYAVRGSARPSPIFLLPLVAKTSHTLERTSVALKYPINIAVPGHGLQNFVDQTRKAAYL